MKKIFISHSHHDREIAGVIKQNLERFGASAFVAHEDIKATQEWQSAIIENLRQCDVFLALLTDRFIDSEWTDQETGIAVALRKIIIPVKIDLDPYGFISKYQALKWDPEKEKASSRKLIRLLIEKDMLEVDNLIEGFAASGTFASAESNAELLGDVRRFSRKQINEIVRVSIGNNQIWDSYGAKPILKKLFSRYSDAIDSELMNLWKKVLREP